MKLSTQQVANYQVAGHHSPVRAMSAGEATRLRAELERFEAEHGAIGRSKFNVKAHLLFPWINEVIRLPSILDAVESLIGPDILVWGSSFFVKDAHDPSFVTWHQDATYQGLEPHAQVSVWLALTPSNAGNGALRVIPGSHGEQVKHIDKPHPDNILSRGQEVETKVDERRAVMMELAPGEFSMHHELLVHGSDPNPSDDRRIGLVIRYIPTHVRQIRGVRYTATLARGEDRHDHFDLEPRPDRELDPDMMAYREAAMKQISKLLFDGAEQSSRFK